MRFFLLFSLVLLTSVCIAGEELTEREFEDAGDSKIVNYENNEQVTEETKHREMPASLQEKSVRMIVGGDSEDGVARKLIVEPK